MKRLIYILLFISPVTLLQGQDRKLQEILKEQKADTACYVALRDAEKSYQDGFYLKCIDLLNNVLKTCSFSKKEKEYALELLAKTYIEVGRKGDADNTINAMLHNNPHYELEVAQNTEDFNRLVKQYNIHPKLSVGFRNTADWVTFSTKKVYKVLDGLDYSVPYKQNLEGLLTGFGLHYYGWAEFEFNRGISLNGDLIFFYTTYERQITKAPGFSLTFWEQDDYLQIPIYVKKYFPLRKNVLPYVTAGFGWLYMTGASADAVITYTEDDVVTGRNIDYYAKAEDMDMTGLRKRHTFEWLAGAGIGYKFRNVRLFFDARYYGGLNSFTCPEEGLEDVMLTDEFFYVDNAVKMNQFELGISISYTFLNSIKKSRK